MNEKLRELNESQREIVYIALAVLIFVCSLYFGCMKTMDKIKKTNEQVDILQSRCDELKKQNSHKADYISAKDIQENSAKSLFSRIPSKVTPEAVISYLAKVESEMNVSIGTITFADESNLSVDGNNGYRLPVNVEYAGSYDNVKKFIEDINNNNDNIMSIDNFEMKMDGTSKLVAGTVNIIFYSIDHDVAKKYEEPKINLEVGRKPVIDLMN